MQKNIILFLVGAFFFFSCSHGPLVSREYLSKIQASTQGDFKTYLKEVQSQTANMSIKATILKHLNSEPLTQSETHALYRLLGHYTQKKYAKEIQHRLAELVKIKTFKRDGLEQHQNPEIKKLGRKLGQIAKSYGLEFINVDNRVFEIRLPGKGSKDLGIYTHGDVVPVNAKKWVLSDGTRLNPFKTQLIDGKIYGRGTEDDKCSIVAALVVMKSIKESGLPVNKNIRLIVETTEETSGKGVEYFKKEHRLPDYNLVLDSSYPIVSAEKGFGSIKVKFPVRQASPKGGPEVERVTGGTAINQIPESSEIVIRRGASLKEKIDVLAKSFIAKYSTKKRPFSISTRSSGKTLHIEVTGVSAHSASPNSGVNPVPRAFLFLTQIASELQFQANHFTDAAKYVANYYGLDFYGKKLGVDYSDSFMGPLTVSVTLIKLDKKQLTVGVNLRNPRGKTADALKAEIQKKLKDYQPELYVGKHMYRDPKGRWISEMLQVFSEITGKKGKPISSAGSTTAKSLPNAVNFGPAMPGEKYMGHNANEFKRLQNFLWDVQMFTEVYLRLGNLKKMI